MRLPRLNVVLHRPIIPWNTGNAGRTCLGFGAALHLIDPGFKVTDKAAKRAGLDYWANVDLHLHASWEDFETDVLPELGGNAFLFSKEGKHGEEPLHRTRFFDGGGFDGGGGIGSGIGMAVGGALALKRSNRLPVAILGDGDYLMGVSGLWTAVHHNIPVLIIVANNRSFFNDELHQERVAIARDRDVNNKGIGIRLDEPDVDLVNMATAQGCVGFGPIYTSDELRQELKLAVKQVKAGKVVVVDARVSRSY